MAEKLLVDVLSHVAEDVDHVAEDFGHMAKDVSHQFGGEILRIGQSLSQFAPNDSDLE